ncbi:cytochrome P450 [Hyaloscypha variabilis F]|uniref:Cytochrome P450 n=1 Tax=Hyaloscypha variabilis (strain UAMH 11265 / GT02V1 / F) TaxID=1149755 RepID=A0A2J6RWG8_HYAVF|nr:cytochrome P450 [Hyaloscypha variabilis F]
MQPKLTIVSTACKIFIAHHYSARARDWECEDPIAQTNRLPLGIDQIWRSLQADKKGGVLALTSQRFQKLRTWTFRASVLGTSTIFTADEKNIQAILATQFNDFDIGPVRRGNFFPLLGNGIFTQDGHSWQHSRALMRPQFAREQVSDLDLEERHVRNMIQILSPETGCWTNPVDLQPLFFRLTLDTATEFLFGYSVNSQLNDVNDASASRLANVPVNEKAFAAAFDFGSATLATRLRFKDKYWMYNPAGFDAACKECHKFIDTFVSLAISKQSASKAAKSGSERYVFLEALAAETQDPIELRSQLLHILLAGRDTTASLLSWLFYSLARDPRRYAKLRQIVLDKFGTHENPTNITFETLKGCTYLRHCLNEALRLYPVVPLNTRQANKDTTLPRGGGKDGQGKIFVPKGMSVDYSVHVMHHRADIWGEDVEVFNPERWEGRKVGWEFLPFNGGPRICIGQQFALTEASYVTVRLLQTFDRMECLETDLVPRHKLSLTSSSRNGVKVRLHVL